MKASLAIVLCALAVALADKSVPIQSLPGFSSFKPCYSITCWNGRDSAFRKLFYVGYEPLGIPKIEPLKIKEMQYENKDAKLTLRATDITVSGLSSFDKTDIEINKDLKMITNKAFVKLHIDGHLEEIYKLEKDHSLELDFDTYIPRVAITLKNYYDIEKRMYDGKPEQFVTFRKFEIESRIIEQPIGTLDSKIDSSDASPITRFLAPMREWSREQLRMKMMEPILKRVAESYADVLGKIHTNFPARILYDDFENRF